MVPSERQLTECGILAAKRGPEKAKRGKKWGKNCSKWPPKQVGGHLLATVCGWSLHTDRGGDSLRLGWRSFPVASVAACSLRALEAPQTRCSSGLSASARKAKGGRQEARRLVAFCRSAQKVGRSPTQTSSAAIFSTLQISSKTLPSGPKSRPKSRPKGHFHLEVLHFQCSSQARNLSSGQNKTAQCSSTRQTSAHKQPPNLLMRVQLRAPLPLSSGGLRAHLNRPAECR